MTIDDLLCTVDTFTSTTITCTPADKPLSAVKDNHPSLAISIDGVGNVATRGYTYMYVAKWSDPESWDGLTLPEEGDAISIIAGRNLLVDVDSTPVLSFIVVEGSLIFAPDADTTHQRYFDAGYIIV